jgi:hypothetical protein
LCNLIVSVSSDPTIWPGPKVHGPPRNNNILEPAPILPDSNNEVAIDNAAPVHLFGLFFVLTGHGSG